MKIKKIRLKTKEKLLFTFLSKKISKEKSKPKTKY